MPSLMAVANIVRPAPRRWREDDEMRRQAADVVESWGDLRAGGPGPEGAIQLSAIDFSRLRVITYPSKYLAITLRRGLPLPRVVFADRRYVYKLWRRGFHTFQGQVRVGAQRQDVASAGPEGPTLVGFRVGLYDDRLCPGFAGGIYVGQQLVGYRMIRGKPIRSLSLEDRQHREFVQHLVDRTLRSGIVYSDLRAANVVKLPDGRLSLVDLDTTLSTLFEFDRRYELRKGALRGHLDGDYRRALLDFFNPACENPSIVEARRLHSRPPKIVAVAHFEQDASDAVGELARQN